MEHTKGEEGGIAMSPAVEHLLKSGLPTILLGVAVAVDLDRNILVLVHAGGTRSRLNAPAGVLRHVRLGGRYGSWWK